MTTETPSDPRPSLAALSAPLVERLVADAPMLRLGVERVGGACVIDAGIGHSGGLEAGRRIAELCMGGLGRVALGPVPGPPSWPFGVTVHSAQPVLACLGSQYAGWSLSHGSGKGAFFALGSGPGRALARQEALFDELAYRDTADTAAFVMEATAVPPAELIAHIAATCGIAADRLTLILTPTQSLAGTTQVVARVLEVALHKLHALGFPLDRVVDGIGMAPLPPPGGKFLTAMGRTNDAILYGGTVHLHVAGPDGKAEDLAHRLPSSASRDHGRPFAEVFAAAKGDFYAIDPMLFSPARVTVTAIDSGRSFHGGTLAPHLVERSFRDVR
ncbi:methenyltetrahydromethanopterin cyclohydrolase [Azospirillum brasilense]|nr:methenyltetrahydromethanopterin cyclohydrolase [Azospirillum brasilense]